MQFRFASLCAVGLAVTRPASSGVPSGELPKLGPPQQLLAGGSPITTVTGHAAPFVLDRDGDGVRDLVVGMFGNDGSSGSDEDVAGGTARVYKNVGSNAAPRYEAFVPLMAKGRPISMESS